MSYLSVMSKLKSCECFDCVEYTVFELTPPEVFITKEVNGLVERLRTLREGMGISQAKLAKEIGVTQASVNRYETDKTTPTVETLLWYAERFDVSMDYIFGRTDNPQGKQYNFLPKMDNSEEFVDFIEMCFDPKSPFNSRLKQALLDMLNDTQSE